MFDVFSELNEIENKIESGEITGFTKWSRLEGECDIVSVGIKQTDQGKSFLEFVLKGKEGQNSFGLRIPSASEKGNAIFMAIENIKRCLFLEYGTFDKIENALKFMQETIQKHGSIPVSYKLREYESMSQKDGKMYTNQSLDAISLRVSDFNKKVSEDIPF